MDDKRSSRVIFTHSNDSNGDFNSTDDSPSNPNVFARFDEKEYYDNSSSGKIE